MTEADGTSFTKRWILRIDGVQRRRPWLAFPYAVFKKFGEDRAGYLAGLVAYYGLFSIFPLLLAMFTVLGFVLADSPDLQQEIIDSTLAQFPVIGDQLRNNVGSIQGNGIALLIGVVIALWAGMAAIRAMQHAVDTVWNVPLHDRPNLVMSRVRAFWLLIVVGGGGLLVAIVAAAGTATSSLGTGDTVLASVLSVATASLVFLVGFKLLSSASRSWRDHLPGAIVAGILFVLLQLVGGYYVGRVVKGAEAVYGLFAVVIGLLSWMHLQARFAVLAVEINAVLADRLWPRCIPGGEPTEVDDRLDARRTEPAQDSDSPSRM